MNQKLTKKINNLETIQRIPVEDILSFISLNKVDKVLDLGAGVGYISLPISKYVDEVTAIDFDEDILNYLDKKSKEKEITNIETLVSDFKDIQLSKIDEILDYCEKIVQHHIDSIDLVQKKKLI